MNDDNHTINEYIKCKIGMQSSLNETKAYIREELKRNSLNNIEENYIEYKYVKYCLEGWFEELPEILKKFKQNDMDNLIENLAKAKTMEDVALLNLSTGHFQLIIENNHLLLRNDCDYILNQVKQHILNYCKQTIEQQNELLNKTKDEIENFFSNYEFHKLINENESLSGKNIKDELSHIFINADSKNDLWMKFFNSQIVSSDVLKTIIKYISNIRNLSKRVKELNQTNLTESYTKEISNMNSYNLASVIAKKYIDKRQNILVICGVHIVLSSISSKLHEMLIESKSTDIYLIALENLFLDYDFENEAWHGKNLAIHAKRIIIIGKRTINVSGLPGEPQTRPSKANNGEMNGNKNGQHGQNGTKGESGGNVTIRSVTIEYEDNLTIKSNGGNGSYGQDGGDGADGEDGKDGVKLTLDEFKKKFPPTSKLIGVEADANVATTYGLIRRMSTEIYRDNMNRHDPWIKACYIEGKTKFGNRIYFSFYRSDLSGCSSYCFVEGICGEPGHPGGFGGSGGYAGEPGYAGDVTIHNRSSDESKINILATDGQQACDGKSGQDGKPGKPGENQPDVGYIDYQFWAEPQYFGPSWLKLVPHREAASDRIRDAEYENEKRYTAIESRDEPEPPASLTIDKKAKQNYQSSRKSRQKATRQCAVAYELLLDMVNDYQCQLSMNSIQSLNININLLQEQILHSQTDKIHIENDNIVTTNPFFNEKHLKLRQNRNNIQSHQIVSSNPMENFQNLYHKQDKETLNYILDMINELKCNVYDYEQMKQIHGLIENLQVKESHSSEYENLKFLVLNKFKLSVLEKLAEFIDNNLMNIIDEWIREDTYPGNNSAIHAALGVQNEFNIFEYRQCQALRNSLKENLNRIVRQNVEVLKYLHQSINYFIETTNDNKDKFPNMQKFLKDHRNSNDNNELADNLPYDIDDNTLSEYGDYISQSEYFLNQYDIILLAYDNDICLNIYVHSDDNRNQYNLIQTYNKTSTNVQHVLVLGDEFIRLSTRKVEDKTAKYLYYKQVLNDIQELNEFDKLIEYSNKKSFEYHEQKNIIIDNDADEIIIGEISDYFPIDTRQAIRLALTPISSKFLPNLNILKSLKNRLNIEKSCITQDILTLLSLSIIDSHNNDEDLTIYQWIVNAYSPIEWINELAIIKFERLTNESCQKIPLWRSKLRTIKTKQIIEIIIMKIEDMNEKFDFDKLLSQIVEYHLIDNEYVDILLDLPLNQWPIQLQHWNFIETVHKSLDKYNLNNDQLSSIIYYLHTLKNKTEILVHRLLKIFQEGQFNNEQLLMICYNFYSGQWQFEEEMIINIQNQTFIDQHSSHRNNDERIFEKLFELINRDKYTTIKEQINKLKNFFDKLSQYKFNDINQQDLLSEDIKQWLIQFKSQPYEYQIENLHEPLSMIERAITILFPEISSLRCAQKLTIASFISSSNNLLAQVATGEGKSLIIVSIMIIKCLLGEQCDIITSSPILAERDANEYKKLYELFDITVSHNSSDDSSQREQAYRSDIVYGDLSSFQRDYLLDRFYNKNILGNRYQNERTNIFVDEVDSMLLDKGNTVLYLSRQLPSLDTLESVYIFIWQMINNDILTGNYSSVDDIEKAVLHNLYPILTKQELTKLTNDEHILDEIWSELIENQNIDYNGKILSCQILYENQNLQQYVKHLEYLLNDIYQHDRQIQIPNYLKSFVEKHLSAWIQSAFQALHMEEGRNYIIDTNRGLTQLDKHPNIIIIDCETGVDQINSQWNECLHQFLQLKHQCKTSLLSLKAVFISNISFFNMYEHIYGVSGTLGSEYERDFLRNIYHVDFLTVPVAYSSKFQENQSILCKDIFEWKNEIIKQSIKISKTRSVLIICQTIKDVEQLSEEFQSENHFDSNQILIYKRSYEKFAFNEHRYLEIGQIIIATNLAGRGTDIKISEELNQNGGLHVILSYLPENYRIEQQAFGRTARKGQSGSAQLIIVDQSNLEYSNESLLEVVHLKNERDFNEMHRIGEVLQYYQRTIQFEENLFERYYQAFSRLKERIDKQWKINVEKKDIVLNSLLNQWAFWLDNINFQMNAKLEIFQSLENLCHQFEQINNFDELIDQLVIEPNQLIKLSKCFIKDKNYDKACQLLQTVINNEPMFSHAAYYYKAHCLIKQTQLVKTEEKTEFHRLLDHAEYLFNYHIDMLIARNSILTSLNLSNQSFVNIDSYRKQNENLCNLYSCFIRSIHDMRGHPITPNTFVNIDIDEKLAMSIYNQMLISDEKIFIRKQFNRNFNENQLKKICMDYQLNYDGFRRYLLKIEYVDEMNLKKYLDHVQMPNRDQFWQLMIEKQIIRNVRDVIIVNRNQINAETNDKFQEFIRLNQNQFQPIEQLSNNQSILFFHNMKFSTENIQCLEGPLDKQYQILEEQNFILLSKIAEINIDQLRKVSIEKFQSISPNDFMQIKGLNRTESKEIYDQLAQQNLIDQQTGKLRTNNLQTIQFSKYEIYNQRIIAILKYQCLYQSQILDLLNQIDSQENSMNNLTLSRDLHKNLLYDLETAFIIKPVYYDASCIDVSLFDSILTKDYSEKLEKLIEQICHIDKKIAKSVAKSLESTIGKLHYLSKANAHLNDFKENFNSNEQFEYIQEFDIFRINGLDHLMNTEEKKWTWNMWLSSGTILLFGCLEIIGGVYLELYTAGLGTHIAAGLISEGLNDIIYAGSAMKNGCFNWNDYFVNKIRSVSITVATLGVSAVISRGIRYSRFGSKIFGNNQYLSRLTGKSLLKQVGQNSMKNVTINIHKQVWCRVGKKLVEGLAFGATNAGISYLSEKILKHHCGRIVDELFINIRQSIEKKKQDMHQFIQQIARMHGLDVTRKFLEDISQSHNAKLWYQKALEYFKIIARIVSNGISNGLKKINYANPSNNSTTIFTLLTSILGPIMKTAPYIKTMIEIDRTTKNFLDDKIEILKERASKCQNERVDINEDHLNNLIKQTTEQWSQEIENIIDTDVRTKLIEPILSESTNYLLRRLGQNIQRLHQRRKDEALFNKFQLNKKAYEKQRESLAENPEQHINQNEIVNRIKNKYHQNLLILMAKTKNPKLIASIIAEGGPMDMICIQAMAHIYGKPIRINNVNGQNCPNFIFPQGKTIDDIHNENSISIDFIPGDGENTFGHFIASGQTNENQIDQNDNNCLIHAITKAAETNQDSIDINSIRLKVVQTIEKDIYIRNMIENGYHRYYISQSVFGGNGNKSNQKFMMSNIQKKLSNYHITLSPNHNLGDQPTHVLNDFAEKIDLLQNLIKKNNLQHKLNETLSSDFEPSSNSIPALQRMHALKKELEGIFTIDVPYQKKPNIRSREYMSAGVSRYIFEWDNTKKNMKISFKGIGDTHTGSYNKWENIIKNGDSKNYIQVKTRNGVFYGIRKVMISNEERNFKRER
ncbi:unnamed protein product [Rotaria socialis]|uniref:Protein translocase subunit SecA n=1 Tax=Rotaria socialis TaxID=392032 RepID=A0A817WGK8_9BILA|nr:unnamed protein product [Rotaria socialis]